MEKVTPEQLSTKLKPKIVPLEAKLVEEACTWKTRSQACIFIAKVVSELFRDVYGPNRLSAQVARAADYLQKANRG